MDFRKKKCFSTALVLIFGTVTFMCGHAYSGIKGIRASSLEKSAKDLAQSYVIPIDAYFKEYGAYNVRELPKTGIVAEGMPVFFYSSKSAVPEKYQKFLISGFEPIFLKSSYKILMIIENNFSGRASLWLIQPSKPIEQIPIEVLLNP